jgi:LysM repeat protein
MMESNSGQSDLARQANNHFGIKCGGNWTGGSYHKEDDDYRDGELIPSCFRSFGSAYECFIAHSDFLADPKKAHRYGPLFSLDPLDYKAWAYGLSKAGYATDPNYAQRLIRIIEQYELFRFDEAVPQAVVAAPSKPGAPEKSKTRAASSRRAVREVNGSNYMTALDGDKLADVANASGKKEANLLKYNDGIYASTKSLPAGARVFLEPKKSAYKGNAKVHKLKSGETMADVSQLYGLKLSALLKRNGLRDGQQPATGEKIYLKGKPDKPLRQADPYQPPVEDNTPKPIEQDAPADAEASTTRPAHGPAPASQKATAPSIAQQAARQHMVAKGDTLYGIARTYGLSVDEIKKKNNLTADTIVIGQKLIIQ